MTNLPAEIMPQVFTSTIQQQNGTKVLFVTFSFKNL